MDICLQLLIGRQDPVLYNSSSGISFTVFNGWYWRLIHHLLSPSSIHNRYKVVGNNLHSTRKTFTIQKNCFNDKKPLRTSHEISTIFGKSLHTMEPGLRIRNVQYSLHANPDPPLTKNLDPDLEFRMPRLKKIQKTLFDFYHFKLFWTADKEMFVSLEKKS